MVRDSTSCTKKVFIPKWIWLYLSQFLTIFDEPKIKLKVINVVTRLCNTCDRLTGCNWFQPVFEQFWMIFEMRQLAIGITPNLGNHNRKMDWTTVQFSLVLWIFLVHRTEPANTKHDRYKMSNMGQAEKRMMWNRSHDEKVGTLISLLTFGHLYEYNFCNTDCAMSIGVFTVLISDPFFISFFRKMRWKMEPEGRWKTTKFQGGRFTVLIFRFIFHFIFDGLCLQKWTKNGSKMRTVSTPNNLLQGFIFNTATNSYQNDFNSNSLKFSSFCFILFLDMIILSRQMCSPSINVGYTSSNLQLSHYILPDVSSP